MPWEAHEVRLGRGTAWCETCGWQLSRPDSWPAEWWGDGEAWAFNFALEHSRVGEPRMCDYCSMPDRFWVNGRAGGDLGVDTWPAPAEHRVDSGYEYLYACEQHRHKLPESFASDG